MKAYQVQTKMTSQRPKLQRMESQILGEKVINDEDSIPPYCPPDHWHPPLAHFDFSDPPPRDQLFEGTPSNGIINEEMANKMAESLKVSSFIDCFIHFPL